LLLRDELNSRVFKSIEAKLYLQLINKYPTIGRQFMCDTVPILPIMNDYKSHIDNDLHRSQGQCLCNVLTDEYQGQENYD